MQQFQSIRTRSPTFDIKVESVKPRSSRYMIVVCDHDLELALESSLVDNDSRY